MGACRRLRGCILSRVLLLTCIRAVCIFYLESEGSGPDLITQGGHMKKRKSRSNEEQLVMPGVVTEEQIVRDYMRKIGRKGGTADSEAQRRHRQAAADRMLASRGLKRRKDRAG